MRGVRLLLLVVGGIVVGGVCWQVGRDGGYHPQWLPSLGQVFQLHDQSIDAVWVVQMVWWCGGGV